MTTKELIRIARIWGYNLEIVIEDDGRVVITVAWRDTPATRRTYESLDTAMYGILDNLKDYVFKRIGGIELERYGKSNH